MPGSLTKVDWLRELRVGTSAQSCRRREQPALLGFAWELGFDEDSGLVWSSHVKVDLLKELDLRQIKPSTVEDSEHLVAIKALVFDVGNG
jgi:hypothetical protein